MLTFVSFLFLILLVPTLLAILFSPNKSEAAWFNESWLYRQQLPISTHTAAETNVYNEITVDTAALTTDKLQADCDDLRFTKENGEILPYQIVSGCDSASTTIRIGFDTMPVAPFNIFMYYGNPSATAGSKTLTHNACGNGCAEGAFDSEEQGQSPVSAWHFDEGTGSTGQDGTAQNNDMTISGPTWQPEDLCVSGKCLYFDGDDRVQRSYDEDTELLPGTNSFTISSWFKHQSTAPASTQAMIVRARSGAGAPYPGYKIYMKTTGVICFGVDSSGSWTPDDEVCSTETYNDSQWHYVAGVKTSTTSIALYIDGKHVQTDGSLTATGSLNGNSAGIYLGEEQTTGGYSNWIGFIDEVKYYNFAKTASQIITEFSSFSSTVGLSASMGQPSTESLNNGIVGYWRMDESAVNLCTGGSNDSCDKSGNGNDGAWNGNATVNLMGKFGNSVSFDGNGDYISVADSTSLDLTSFTIAAWVYPTDLNAFRTIVGKNTAYAFTLDTNGDGYLRTYLHNGSSSLAVQADTDALVTNTWQHVVSTFDGKMWRMYKNGVLVVESENSFSINNSSSNMLIGLYNTGDPTESWAGNLDEVRMYNRALSPAEIRQLYHWAPGPSIHLKFDENTGTTSVFDTSGNGKTGTLNNFTTNAWTVGKYGTALKFNGTNQYISVATPDLPTRDFTYEMWVFSADHGSNSPRIIMASDGSGGNEIGIFTDSAIELQLNGANYQLSDTGIPTNVWNHIAVTRQGSAIVGYLNGVKEGGASDNATLNFSTCALLIGVDNDTSGCTDSLDNYNLGKIDDLRIYNYARTRDQIIEDMNGGHPMGGSPVGSQLIYAKLDEQNGTVVNNSGFGNDPFVALQTGTNTGAAWLTSTSCKVNGCLNFDTTTDNVSFGTFDYLDNNASMAASFWINPQTLATSRAIVSKIATAPDNNTFAVVTDATNNDEVRVYIASDASDTSNYFLTSNLNLTASTWQYVSFVYNGTNAAANRVTVYKNGKPVSGSVTGTIPTDIAEGGTANLQLGDDQGSTHTSLAMYLDEFKLYNSALTQDEIYIDYNLGSSVNFSTGTNEATLLADGAGAAPVGWWKLDEGKGLGTDVVKDISGYNNHGTPILMEAEDWVLGNYGNGLRFDGTTEAVRIYDPAGGELDFGTGNMSVSAWVRSVSTETFQRFVSKSSGGGLDAGYRLGINNGDDLYFQVGDGSNVDTPTNTTSGVNDGKWHHVTGVWTPGVSAVLYMDSVQIAQDTTLAVTGSLSNSYDIALGAYMSGTTPTTSAGNSLEGYLDEVKIWNYALTNAQVAYEHDRGKPIFYFKFDECQGTTAYDAAGHNNNGTIAPGSTTNTAVGYCSSGTSTHMWNDGTTGKFNGSLGFDNDDDVVSVANDSRYIDMNVGLQNGFTFSAWVYPNSSGESSAGRIFQKGADGSTTDTSTTFCRLEGTTPLDITCLVDLATTDANFTYSAKVPTGQWSHIAFSWTNDSDDEVTIWVNGVPSTSTASFSGNTATENLSLFIGGNGSTTNSRAFDGLIDEFAIYSYELSATQIKNLMNQGGGVRFGPVTGSP